METRYAARVNNAPSQGGGGGCWCHTGRAMRVPEAGPVRGLALWVSGSHWQRGTVLRLARWTQANVVSSRYAWTVWAAERQDGSVGPKPSTGV